MTETHDFFFSLAATHFHTQRLQKLYAQGLVHSSRIEPRDPRPGQEVTLLFSHQVSCEIDAMAVYYTIDGSIPQGNYGQALHGQVVLAQRQSTAHYDQELDMVVQEWRAALPAQAEGTLVQYRADAWNLQDLSFHWLADYDDSTGTLPAGGRCFAYHVDTWSAPDWWRDAIVYEIFVDRFHAASTETPMRAYEECPITDFFGGTLQGILEQLDYLHNLGINCLWLSPICESPTHHGYNVSDFFTMAQRYGGNATLRKLVTEAHQRGMRIIMDYAPNHTSEEHAAFISARQDPDSATSTWYEIGPQFKHGYRCYFDVPSMPELNTELPEVRRHLYDAARYWIEEFGIDALRLDYVPGPSHAFWTGLQHDIKTHFPDVLTLGEAIGSTTIRDAYAGRMDACMDFALSGMLRSTFALRETTLTDFLHFVHTQPRPAERSMAGATLLDNHDMHRFLWLAQGDVARLKLAAACHLTLEGTPIIYYGTEIGLSQYGDAHQENALCRTPMIWDERQNLDLLHYYQHLIALRKAHPALRRGSFETVSVTIISSQEDIHTASTQVGAYHRCLDNDELLIILNNNPFAVNVCSSLLSRDKSWTVLFGSAEHFPDWQAQGDLYLPALSAVILQRQAIHPVFSEKNVNNKTVDN